VCEEKSTAMFGVFAYFVTRRAGPIVKMAMEKILVPFFCTVLKCMDNLWLIIFVMPYEKSGECSQFDRHQICKQGVHTSV